MRGERKRELAGERVSERGGELSGLVLFVLGVWRPGVAIWPLLMSDARNPYCLSSPNECDGLYIEQRDA